MHCSGWLLRLRNAPVGARRRRTERFEQITNLVERGMSLEQVNGASGKQTNVELVPTAALVTGYSP